MIFYAAFLLEHLYPIIAQYDKLVGFFGSLAILCLLDLITAVQTAL